MNDLRNTSDLPVSDDESEDLCTKFQKVVFYNKVNQKDIFK